MAAPDIPTHESPIRTPKQLLIIVALAFIVPIIVSLLLANLAASGLKQDPSSLSAESVAQRIKPVANVVISEGGSEAKGARTGEQVLQSTCNACHETGAAGAPKMGDRAAWAKRIAEGQRALTQTAIKGIRAMPPRGGNPDLTDLEVERSVVVMANRSGGNFKEPAAPKPAAPAAKAAAK